MTPPLDLADLRAKAICAEPDCAVCGGGMLGTGYTCSGCGRVGESTDIYDRHRSVCMDRDRIAQQLAEVTRERDDWRRKLAECTTSLITADRQLATVRKQVDEMLAVNDEQEKALQTALANWQGSAGESDYYKRQAAELRAARDELADIASRVRKTKVQIADNYYHSVDLGPSRDEQVRISQLRAIGGKAGV